MSVMDIISAVIEARNGKSLSKLSWEENTYIYLNNYKGILMITVRSMYFLQTIY